MKKILLTTMFIAAFGWMMNAQVWEFTNTKDGWTNIGSTATTQPTYLELTTKQDVKDPGLKIEPPVPAVDPATVSVVAVTLKNVSADGPAELRAVVVTAGDASSGTIYLSVPITKGDTEFQTYYFDLSSSSKWVGTEVSSMKFLFKGPDNTDFYGTGNEVFDIDKIEMLTEIPKTEKHVWNFDTDGDSEHWESINGAIEAVTGGVLTFNPTANKYAKLEQPMNYVVADDYNWLRLILQNNSTGDTEITLITSIARIAFTVTTEDVDFKTYEIRLDTIGGGSSWTGNAEDITLRFADGVTGKSTGTGSFDIDLIEFFYSPTTRISKEKANDLVLAPNPSLGVFRLNSNKNPIAGYTVFNSVGQVLKHENSVNDMSTKVDLSGANKGLYFIRVNYENGKSQVVEAIIK